MRIKNLDILRGLAILLVLGRHMSPYFPDNLNIYVANILKAWLVSGWIGVDLFFVLSGFLVSGLLFSEYKKFGQISYKRFFTRRALKIYPSFYIFLAFSVLLFYDKLASGKILFMNILSELLYFQNYVYGIWQHTWSLAVEEHFYILLPLLLLLILRMTKRLLYLPALIVSTLFGILIFRSVTVFEIEELNLQQHFYPTHLRIDSLLYGVLISYLYHFKKSVLSRFYEKYKIVLLLGSFAAIPIVLYFFLNSPFLVSSIGFTILYLAFGNLLLFAIFESTVFGKRKMMIANMMAKIGVYSYSIYLWHVAVSRFLINYYRLYDNYYLYLITYILLSIIIGTFVSKIVEYPVLKLRDRYYPSMSKIKVEPKDKK